MPASRCCAFFWRIRAGQATKNHAAPNAGRSAIRYQINSCLRKKTKDWRPNLLWNGDYTGWIKLLSFSLALWERVGVWAPCSTLTLTLTLSLSRQRKRGSRQSSAVTRYK